MSTTRGVVQLKMTLMGCAATGKSSLITRIRGHEGPLPLTKPTIFQETSAVHYDGDDDLDDEDDSNPLGGSSFLQMGEHAGVGGVGDSNEILEEVMDYRTFCCAGAKT